MDIIKLTKENGFFQDMISYMTDGWANILEYDEKHRVWCYLRGDESGRDFYSPIPIDYITEDERKRLEELLIEDCGIEDYEWNMDVDEVKELLYEDEFLDALFEHLQK